MIGHRLLLLGVLLSSVPSLVGLIPSVDRVSGPALAAQPSLPKSAAALSVARKYAEALASGDRVAAAQLDFACQYRMVSANARRLTAFPPPSASVYAECWEPLAKAHETAIERREQGMDGLWPGAGNLVFLKEDLSLYPASVFVMDLLGLSPPAGGLRIRSEERRVGRECRG